MRLLNKTILSNFDNQIWLLSFGLFVNLFGTSSYPFISLYLYQYRGMSMASIGFALMVAALIGGVAQLAGGEFCDRWGRKRIMNFGILLQIVAFIMLAFAVAMKLGYLEFLLIITLIEVSGGLYRNIPYIMVGDLLKEGKRDTAFSLLQVGYNLGLSLGPLVGGLVATFSYPALFLIAALTNCLYIVLSFTMLRDTRAAHERMENRTNILSIFADRAFIVFCMISAIISIVFAQKLSTFSAFAGSFVHIPEYNIGLLFSLSGFMLVFLQLPMTRYFERFNTATVLAIGALFYILGFGALGLCGSIYPLIGCMVLITFGDILFTPSSLSLISQMASDQNRGRYMSISRVIGRSGYAFGPLIGGYLMDKFSNEIWVMWAILGLVGVIGLAGILYLKRLLPKSN